MRNELEAMELVDDEMEARQRRQKLETAEAAAALVGVQKAEGRQWMTAAKEGRTRDLAQMLAGNPKLLQYRGEGTNFSFTGHTALHWCAAKAHAEGVRFLLGEGADPNAPNNAGSTPLHAAAANGNVDCAKILILCGGADHQAGRAWRVRQGCRIGQEPALEPRTRQCHRLLFESGPASAR